MLRFTILLVLAVGVFSEEPVLLLQPADATFLAKKKAAAAAVVAAVKKPFVALGLVAPPVPAQGTDEAAATSAQQIVPVYDVPAPAPQHALQKPAYSTIVLNIQQPSHPAPQHVPVQPRPQESLALPQASHPQGIFGTRSQGIFGSRPQGIFGSRPQGIFGSRPYASGFGYFGQGIQRIPGNLASLWGSTQQAVVAQTNRVRDRFSPLKPLSYLLSRSPGSSVSATTSGQEVEYKFAPNLGFTHYNVIHYYPVKTEEKHSEGSKISTDNLYPPISDLKTYPAAEPAKEYKAPPQVYIAPKTKYSAPKTEYSVPKTEYRTPVQEYKLEYTLPRVDYAPPKPEYQAPQQEYSAPKLEYQAPLQDYTVPQVPAQDYSVPKIDYQTPVPEYTPPKAEYQAPLQEYAAPIVVYEEPKSDLEVPKVDYAAPVEYHTPTLEYSASKTSYGTQALDYSAPAQDYSVPVQSSPAQDAAVPAAVYRSDLSLPSTATYSYKLVKS